VCTACPDGAASSGDFTVCLCEVGSYATSSALDMTCARCPVGAVCSRPGVQFSQITAADDWWRPSNDSLRFYRCLVGGQCKDNGCADYREGPLCALCQK
jgi:hypothetical protein